MQQLLWWLAAPALVYVSPGCSWYEHHMLGGCRRPTEPAKHCPPIPMPAATAAGSAASRRLAVIIPFRGAVPDDFAPLCSRLPAHLERHGVPFHLLAARQVDAHPFNRAALANAAFAVLQRGGRQAGLKAGEEGYASGYVALHDVDRFPVAREANRSCEAHSSSYYAWPGETPRVLHGNSLAGGVLLLRSALFRGVNGFSNRFWGWGHEDNELYLRLRACGRAPIQGAEVSSCIEHQDCEQCRRAKPSGTLAELRAETRSIAILHARLAAPDVHMHRDGLSTANYSLPSRSPRRVACGGHKLHVLDVRLHRPPTPTTAAAAAAAAAAATTATSAASAASAADLGLARRGARQCATEGRDVDGVQPDDGCLAFVDPAAVPRQVLASALPDGKTIQRRLRATRARAMYNYNYEVDVETKDAAGQLQVFRVAVCEQAWRATAGADRFQLLWRATRTAKGRPFRLDRDFGYAGHFPCELWPRPWESQRGAEERLARRREEAAGRDLAKRQRSRQAGSQG